MKGSCNSTENPRCRGHMEQGRDGRKGWNWTVGSEHTDRGCPRKGSMKGKGGDRVHEEGDKMQELLSNLCSCMK